VPVQGRFQKKPAAELPISFGKSQKSPVQKADYQVQVKGCRLVPLASTKHMADNMADMALLQIDQPVEMSKALVCRQWQQPQSLPIMRLHPSLVFDTLGNRVYICCSTPKSDVHCSQLFCSCKQPIW